MNAEERGMGEKEGGKGENGKIKKLGQPNFLIIPNCLHTTENLGCHLLPFLTGHSPCPIYHQ